MGAGKGRWRRKMGNHCAGKTPFVSEEEARECNPLHTPYVCPTCGAWHLTSSSMLTTGGPRRSERQRRRARFYQGRS